MSKSWLIAICVVSVVSGILSCVMPRSYAKKAYQYVSCVVLIYALLYPFISGSVDTDDLKDILYDDNSGSSYEFSLKSEEIYLLSAQSGCVTAAENVLKQKNVAYDEIEAQCTPEDGEIILKRLSVYGSYTDEQKEQIKKTLSETFDKKTTIEFVGDKDEHR